MKKKCLYVGICLFALSGYAEARKKWEVWENCRLIPNAGNDGDSFRVRKRNGRYTYILRLYFVDAPETDETLTSRIAEQADYWGIDTKQILRMGTKATRFTKAFLEDGFTVYTKKEKTKGRSEKSRYYALIKVKDRFLSTALVEAGLARLYGRQVETPAGVPKATTLRLRHKKAERAAKAARRGAWTFSGSRRMGPRSRTTQDVRSAVVLETRDTESQKVKEAITERKKMTVENEVRVFSLRNVLHHVATLKPGAEIMMVGEPSATMLRIRFKGAEGKLYEAQCRRSDLGL